MINNETKTFWRIVPICFRTHEYELVSCNMVYNQIMEGLLPIENVKHVLKSLRKATFKAFRLLDITDNTIYHIENSEFKTRKEKGMKKDERYECIHFTLSCFRNFTQRFSNVLMHITI